MINKIALTLIVCCSILSSVYGQKKTLDTANYKEWKSLGIPSISADGEWIAYNTSDQQNTKLLVNVKTGKKKNIKGIQSFVFFAKGKWIKYTVKGGSKDSLFLVRLRDNKKIYWNRPEYIQEQAQVPLISYTVNGKEGRSLVFRNLESGDSSVFKQMGKYTIYNGGTSILYIEGKQLKYGIIGAKSRLIAENVTDFDFNEKRNSLNFVAQSKLYAYSFIENAAELILDFAAIKGPEGYNVVAKAYSFNKGDRDLQMEVTPLVPVKYKRPEPVKPKATGFDLELWTWNEAKTQRLQRKGSYLNTSPEQVTFIYHTDDQTWFSVAAKPQGFVMVPAASHFNLVLQTDPEPYKKTVDWRYDNNFDVYSVNTHTNERKLVVKDSYSLPQWSPNGKHAILYDRVKRKWMSLEDEQNEFREFSDQIGFPVYEESHDLPSPAPAYGIAGWADAGNSILLYDRYDIWVVDLNGKKPVRSLTQEYGRKHQVVLRLQGSEYQEKLDITKPLLFTGFREATKSEGIYQLMPGKAPIILADDAAYNVRILAKAEDGSFAFTKKSYNMFPDIWYANATFSKQKQLTYMNQQQKTFNWGTAKLFRWKTFEGKDNEGLLYLPEGYDAKKKYPMIVDFYETHSQDLHDYLTPLYSTCTIDIPSYVSKGYVVFRPDVHFKVGTPGESAYNCVVSGTEALVKEGVADPAHIGLQGHSWSGFEVAYILTRTSMFTCSNVGAGVVNSTYNYFAIRANGAPCLFKYESEQSRIGGSLWEKKKEFIENSPIFNADKIKTPLLIFHNDKDGAVAFTQGLDLFLAMRRLEKPAWLLNYKGENHTLDSEPAQRDWTLRMGQFFDHYLKNKPAPRWMTEGINVDERNVDLKYDY
ncbi:prolyl oligopeptidase family serine peptidase [Pedobacter sp. MC2016-14]|uniref:alpha/beta hydrolase family protein n=1 Tax=Pedobacter sp. MC2016-14 TaxID=2897327 RepID=UPI001E31CB08|nr:prolyl oligopeptidase family serine peptidase [Pedobacter sp. MC2016-14]MCD0488599.1 prolyl oligopeptidase family serine peptidase [Pedobacter sp. MC2016-14]